MDKDEQKLAIYDRLSPRRKKFIDRIGYSKWDPFQEPKHPIETRQDATKRTAQQLFRDFFDANQIQEYSNAYGRGVYEMCMGVFNRDERYRGIFEFCLWYERQLRETGLTADDVWEG
ncbi:MAG: hypothetical protein K9K64_17470 [Desulfohalobiaceae bacterium]|nr:hypothetical protein [Desulfohalobiaceae bacterium]